MNWTVYATIQAEEFGINSQNVDSFLTSDDPAIKRFLGVDTSLGEAIGLDPKFAYNIVKKVGNYGEIFERNLGKATKIGFDRDSTGSGPRADCSTRRRSVETLGSRPPRRLPSQRLEKVSRTQMTDARAAPPPAEETGLAAFRRWWGDHALAQAVGLGAAAILAAFLASNVLESMRRLGMSPSLDYLTQPANFDISESLIVYRAGDPYARAILVGLLNTLKLAVSGCALATVLGVALGLLRAAGNPLLARLVAAYVEVARNTPLVLQLFFWISLTHALPPVRQALEPLPFTYLSVRGISLPGIRVEGGAIWPIVVFLVFLGLVVHAIHRRLGRPLSAREWLLVLTTAVIVPAGWILARASGSRSMCPPSKASTSSAA